MTRQLKEGYFEPRISGCCSTCGVSDRIDRLALAVGSVLFPADQKEIAYTPFEIKGGQKSMSGEHVCLNCGACCTSFRVSFYWGEADPAFGGSVPIELTEKLSESRRVMKGTNQPRPRCIALAGTVSAKVACTIYEDRPTPCRAFPISWENGVHNPDCDRVRALIGLPPVTPEMLRVVEEIGPVPSEEPLQGICGRVVIPTLDR